MQKVTNITKEMQNEKQRVIKQKKYQLSANTVLPPALLSSENRDNFRQSCITLPGQTSKGSHSMIECTLIDWQIIL